MEVDTTASRTPRHVTQQYIGVAATQQYAGITAKELYNGVSHLICLVYVWYFKLKAISRPPVHV